MQCELTDKVELRTRTGRAVIWGVEFDLVQKEEVINEICAWRAQGRRGQISFVNPYSVSLCRRDDEMRRAVQDSALTLPDGIGIVLAASLLAYANSGRLSGPEMMLFLCDKGRKHGLRHYFYGGGPGVAEKLASRLSERYQGLTVAGCSAPPFRPLSAAEEELEIARINEAQPDLLWVGLGAPKQEKWIARHKEVANAAAMLGVGAAFDFHSGNVPWCPEFIRAVGLEWAYRFMRQPGKLWRRYLDAPAFVAGVTRQALSVRFARLWQTLS